MRVIAPDSSLHGTTSAYRWGCRCEACKTAHTEYARAYRQAHHRPTRGSNLVKPDVAMLRLYLGDATPDCWPKLARTIDRALAGHYVSLYSLDAIACTLGAHVDSLISEEVSA
jgi:fermentation-respiration switch protein FrsA (DUF1100 family)